MTLLTPELLPTKTYPFAVLRYLLAQQGGGIQAGVIGATDLQVVQRGAGANMSVDVGAGGAWVLGTDATRQGLYHVVNDATVNVVIAAADATNPRVDQIVLKVNDSSILGASDTPALQVVQGTPTAGAQVINPAGANYRAGAAALPNTALRAADLLVPAAAASIVTANIQDRRPWARGAYNRILRTGGNYTTSSGTFANIDGVNLNPKIECSGVPLRVSLRGLFTNATDASSNYLTLLDNGGGIDGLSSGNSLSIGASAPGYVPIGFFWDWIPAAGLHQITPQFATSSGTFTVLAQAGGALIMTVEELVRQNQANG